MTDRFEIDPENGWVDTVIENAARAMYEAEWGSWDETLESVRSIYRNRASAVAAAGLLRTEPAVHPADVPQPGDRVRVTWRRTGNTRESVVDEHGYYEGKGAVLMYPDTVTVEVIEPAPAAASAATGQRAFGLFAIGDRDGARAELAAANLKTLLAIGDIAHALNELVVDVLRSRPADAGEETDR